MEERLTLTEDRVSRIIAFQRNSMSVSSTKANMENVTNQA
jgi:hypothetical protein